MAQPNYSAEMTAKIISDYQNGVDVADIATSIEKSVRSVRSKLVREGVHRPAGEDRHVVNRLRPRGVVVQNDGLQAALPEGQPDIGNRVAGPLRRQPAESLAQRYSVQAYHRLLCSDRYRCLTVRNNIVDE